MMDRYKKAGDYLIDFCAERGIGGQGRVYVCTKDSKQYAVKIINRKKNNASSSQEYAEREKKSMLNSNDENIVFLHEYLQSNSSHYFIMQLCEGNLYDLIGQSPPSEKKAIEYLAQIVNGYTRLYDNKIIHRDLKPQNILFLGSKLKIADFGISRTCFSDQPDFYTFDLGTEGFKAPEVYRQKYNYKVDIWSIGVIFYFMLHASIPWERPSPVSILQPFTIKQSISEESKDFITKCLKIQPNQRISLKEMLGHQIFKNNRLWKMQDTYAEQIMQQIVQIVSSQPTLTENAKTSLDYYSTITNSLSCSQFDVFIRSLCSFVDKTKAELIYNFYKDQKNQVSITMLRHMFLTQKAGSN